MHCCSEQQPLTVPPHYRPLYFFFLVINCTVLEDPDNGELHIGGVSFGSEVFYSCDKGFILTGDTNRTCQADGNWTGSAPVCNGKHKKRTRVHKTVG